MKRKKPSKTFTAMLSITGALAVMIIFMMGTVLAEQTVKTIEVPQGFIALPTSAGSPYVTTININPPDGVADIAFFEVILKGDFQASTEVKAKVRKTGTETLYDCSPSSWTTPSVDTPNYEISFDCSALANQFDFTTGKIDAGFSVSKTAQNVKGYAKMTYYNNPKGNIGVFGTEYEIYDSGTVFLQLKDNQGLPVNNGSCIMDVYYPNQPNITHSAFLMDAPLTYLNGSDGIYYYDLNIPNVTGVYMISASCSYAFQKFDIHPPGSSYSSKRSAISGSYLGDTLVLNDPSDYLYTYCGSTGGGTKACEANYTWDITPYGINTSQITSIYYNYLGETSTNGVLLTMYAWNYTSGSWVTLSNTMTFSGLAKSGFPTGINDHLANSITDSPQDFINSSGNIKVKLSGTLGTNFDEYDNWVALSIQTESGVIIDVKGSGELHVENHFANLTDYINQSIGNLTNLTAEDVWNYPFRNLTYFNYTPIYDYIDLLALNMSANFTDVFIRLSEINTTTQATYTYIQGMNNLSADDVWSYANRTLTDYNLTDVLTLLNGINQTAYNIRAFQLNELSANLTEIQLWLQDINETANNTYDYLTGLVNLSAYDIWNYTNRTLTYYPAQTDLTNYTLIQGYVWNATDRNLTYFNYTPIYNDLDTLNSTLLQAIADSNVTLYNAIASSNSSILARVDAHNGTIMTKLYLMQDEIADMNASILGEIALTNSSLYQAIVDSNTSIIGRVNQHNNTVMMYLYSMQDDIDDIEDNTVQIISDVADVYNVTEEVWWLVWNLTVGNVSVTANVNWTEGAVKMNDITDPVIIESQLLTFAGRDQSPIEKISDEYCLNNSTLAYDINTTRCFLDQCFTINETFTVNCDYGCYNGACNPEPFDRSMWLILIFLGVVVVIILLAFAYDRFTK